MIRDERSRGLVAMRLLQPVQDCHPTATRMTRRRVVTRGLAAAAVAAAGAGSALAASGSVLRFGLTPVFLTNDLELLTKLRSYLARMTGREVQLVQRRTYEEITSLLVSGQLDAAWICGYPFAAYRDQLALVAVPVWNGKPLYQAYLIARSGRSATGIAALEGDVHAFSDPNSNSGYLVTAAELAALGRRPSDFFRQVFFTYGHRNVVRAVASGLAQSGSVDGYVWDVMAEIEPALTGRTIIVRRSEWLGFPPIACPRALAEADVVVSLKEALISMAADEEGRSVLSLLRIDGFSDEASDLFDSIAAKMRAVRSFG
jgi:phosphonate transport system substrate-binding protein